MENVQNTIVWPKAFVKNDNLKGINEEVNTKMHTICEPYDNYTYTRVH